jgi:uncharacterized protein (UPF0218 family)
LGDLVLNDHLRLLLQIPLGRLIPDYNVDKFLASLSGSNKIVTVGDRTTRRCVEAGLKPFLEIIDYREKREETQRIQETGVEVVTVENPAGRITEKAIQAVRSSLKVEGRRRIVVNGEEDLLVLPVTAFAEQGFKVLYGQPDMGLVSVEVDEAARERAKKIMRDMGWAEEG